MVENINGTGVFSETETCICLLLQEVPRGKCWREEISKSLVFKEVKIAQRKMAIESAVLSYHVLLICTLYVLTFGSHVRKLTSDDLRNIGQSTNNNFIAVFFDKPGELKLLYVFAACNIVFCGDHLFKTSRDIVYLVFVVYFMLYLYVLDIKNSYPKFAREFVKSSDVLEPFGIELAQVGNRKIGILQTLCALSKFLL